MAKNKPTRASETPSGKNMSDLANTRMSVGAIASEDAPATKTSGIKIRGTGAATKGLMARGPMA